MTSKFKVGDVVQLKSGGPIMTVGRVIEDSSHFVAHVTWFNEKNKQEFGSFAEDLLDKYEP